MLRTKFSDFGRASAREPRLEVGQSSQIESRFPSEHVLLFWSDATLPPCLELLSTGRQGHFYLLRPPAGIEPLGCLAATDRWQ